ncbi:Cyclic pyranopterin monophosphate synthase [Pseudomonas carbonaria]|uniref:cyclic pyranopterin monophosphate synthase n=2 Tax=Zestomonas carbonaria TaxID=2762745 RepID=A0A7U7I7K7_9GAMM|nr:Cyclic pyranopterin monophosphate synthase [Pseudomonas carbonaria]
MVDVTDKAASQREAVAETWLRMKPDTLRAIESGEHPKGDVFAVARIAGIMAAKRSHELIPLCHPLLLTAISVDIKAVQPDSVRVTARCALTAATGGEMEALTAASIAALPLYDMCKAIDRGMQIDWVRLLKKTAAARYWRPGRYSEGGTPSHCLKARRKLATSL